MPKTVLVVDSMDSTRFLAKMFLKNAGFDVMEATSGEEAIEKLRFSNVNLIMCDYNMPQMDGISFMKRVRADAARRYTPIIMCSSKHHESLMHDGLAAGASLWILKPYKPSDVVGIIGKIMRPD